MPLLFYKPAFFLLLLFGLMPVKDVAIKPHPIHVSTTDVNFNPKDDKMEVSVRAFTDDFELALQKQFNTKADLQKPAIHEAMDVLVKNYLALHLHIKAGNTNTPLNYLGFEIDKEAVDIYLESEKLPVPKKIEVEVSLLHNIFDDQISIVHMTVNGLRKSSKVIYPEKNIEQVF